jgi:glucose-1-phosphate cytidylyltransferase
LKVVLFCGGLGMRMRDGVTNAPKPMAMIGDRPLLWHVMRYYAHYGHTDFVLCLGYGASAVKDFFLSYDETRSNDFVLENGAQNIKLFKTDIADWRITFVDTGLQSAIGERLRRVRRFVEGEEMFLANYADVFTDAPLPDMISRFAASDAVASLLAVPPQSSHHVVDVADDGLVTQVVPFRNLRQWENGGYFALRPEIFEYLNEGEDLVEDALPRLVQRRRVLAYPYKGYWSPADTVKERAHLEDMYYQGRCPWMVWDPERSGAAKVTGAAAAVASASAPHDPATGMPG